MYYEHFGLAQAPFKITPNTDFFFSGGNRGPVLEALIYAITRGEGIVKVTGEVGSGKTMLCNMLQNRLPENVESVYLANPSVAPEDVLHAIAFELQLGVDRHADRLEVMHELQDYLVTRHAEGQRVVVFIEESQSMPVATLEEIRLLSNLETRNDKLLQIVMFGQPELDEILRRPDIRQLRDRIAHSFRLQPLTNGEVREYLTFRMRAAGYRGPEIFSPPIVKQIARASSGLTRRVNLIADKALLAAFAENTHTIQARHIHAALGDSEFGRPASWWRGGANLRWAALALVIGAGLGAGLYALLDTRPKTAGPIATPAAKGPLPMDGKALPQAAATGTGVETLPRSSSSVVAAFPDASVSASPMTAASAEALATAGNLTRSDQGFASDRGAGAPATTESSGGSAVSAMDMQTATAEARVPPTGAAVSDIIASRFQATDEWLRSGRTAGYTIQILASNDEAQLRNHLKALPKFIEVNDVYMYRSAAQNGSIVNVLWGTYTDWQAAQDGLEVLPGSLRTNRPYVRALSAIRADINRQRDSGRR